MSLNFICFGASLCYALAMDSPTEACLSLTEGCTPVRKRPFPSFGPASTERCALCRKRNQVGIVSPTAAWLSPAEGVHSRQEAPLPSFGPASTERCALGRKRNQVGIVSPTVKALQRGALQTGSTPPQFRFRFNRTLCTGQKAQPCRHCQLHQGMVKPYRGMHSSQEAFLPRGYFVRIVLVFVTLSVPI